MPALSDIINGLFGALGAADTANTTISDSEATQLDNVNASLQVAAFVAGGAALVNPTLAPAAISAVGIAAAADVAAFKADISVHDPDATKIIGDVATFVGDIAEGWGAVAAAFGPAGVTQAAVASAIGDGIVGGVLLTNSGAPLTNALASEITAVASQVNAIAAAAVSSLESFVQDLSGNSQGQQSASAEDTLPTLESDTQFAGNGTVSLPSLTISPNQDGSLTVTESELSGSSEVTEFGSTFGQASSSIYGNSINSALNTGEDYYGGSRTTPAVNLDLDGAAVSQALPSNVSFAEANYSGLDGSGTLTSQTISYDDGSSTITDYDNLPPGAVSQQYYYDASDSGALAPETSSTAVPGEASGTLESSTTTFADGNSQVTIYTPALNYNLGDSSGTPSFTLANQLTASGLGPLEAAYAIKAVGEVVGAQNDPLVFDVGGHGITIRPLASGSTSYDFSGSGLAEETSWIGAGTGFLAIVGSDGLVDNASDLIDSFAQLVALDANGDGIISGAELDSLVVWQDLNSDGVCEAGEVTSLAALGVVSISLQFATVDENLQGYSIEQAAVAIMHDGSTREIAAVDLQGNPVVTSFEGTYILTPTIEALPNVRGLGLLPSLWISMSTDQQLVALAQDTQATSSLDTGAFDSALQAELYEWAGVESVNPSSGQLFDGQELGFLQSMSDNYGSFYGTVEPHFVGQANYLQESWDTVFSAIKARLLVQDPYSVLEQNFTYNVVADVVLPSVSFSDAIKSLAANAPTSGQDQAVYWSNALSVINDSVSDLSAYTTLSSTSIATELQAVLPSYFSPQLIAAAAAGNLSFVEGTALGNVLVGTSGPDLFQATAPDTVLEGFGGSDLFIVDAALGSTEINEVDDTVNPSNILLIEGVSAAQVAVSGDASGDVILDLGDGSSIKIDQMLFQTSYGSENAQGHNQIGVNSQTAFGVQEVEFEDGTVWTAAQVIAAEEADQAGAARIYGTSDADLIDGRGIATYEQGNGGGDTFVYDQGYGQLEINEVDPSSGPDNVLRFGQGVTASEVAVTEDRAGDVILTDGITGDRIQIDGMLNSSKDGIQAIDFADGSAWTSAQVLALATTGTTGSDDLYGTPGADVFHGKGGGDYEQGNGGGDTFIFNQGYGALEVNEYDSNSSDRNVLALGAGIDPDNVQVSGDAGGNVVISDGTGGDAVTLDNMLVSPRYGVQEVTFADGTVWTAAQVEALATTGTAGNDKLYGTPGADIFDGKGGTDYEQGNGGGDTFVFNTGYGPLGINEEDNNPNDYNVLSFGNGIEASNVAVSADTGGDVILTVGGNGDRVQIDNMLDGPRYGVQLVEFGGRDRMVGCLNRSRAAGRHCSSVGWIYPNHILLGRRWSRHKQSGSRRDHRRNWHFCIKRDPGVGCWWRPHSQG